jgi:hypothetical protein
MPPGMQVPAGGDRRGMMPSGPPGPYYEHAPRDKVSKAERDVALFAWIHWRLANRPCCRTMRMNGANTANMLSNTEPYAANAVLFCLAGRPAVPCIQARRPATRATIPGGPTWPVPAGM